ncbi:MULTISPECIES: lanthionine synthetase LanC family protein [unclassified Chryseobacterium]|uniref:lanthionine synthetase LanC family protein n=1 Tax=unclassified Chryseobacterium TaxID=2593645 RepID=UPI000F4556F9|nr:lanthionine synthetase LanC family protein [Chryseobacterium sp. G0240]ROI06419.1 hypothetical protein EGI16_00490 [Chryseobacterium sp. G0240]
MNSDAHIKTLQIKETLSEYKDRLHGVGISNGLLGLSLFHYYHFKYSQQEQDIASALEILEECIEKLDDHYSSYTTKTDIIELGLYIQFLFDSDILDVDENLLSELDEIILEITSEQIEKKNIHNITGALSGGTYFLKRQSFEKRTEILLKILSIIEQKAIKKNDHQVYWEVDFRKKNNTELNLNHGIAGVLSFLIKLYNNNIEKEKCKELILKGINFILAQKKVHEMNWFPQFAFENEFLEHHNLSYGDIGIGYIITKAGESIQNDNFYKQGLEILENCANYRDDSQQYIKDANLIYGASGLSSFFNVLYQKYNKGSFKAAYTYWHHKVMEFGSTDSQWAGYRSHFNNDHDFVHLSFAQGILGIGISLLSNAVNDSGSFLSFLKYDIQ